MNADPKFILHFSYLTIGFHDVTVVENGLFFTRGKLIRQQQRVSTQV